MSQESCRLATVLMPSSRPKEYATLSLDLIALSDLVPPSPVPSPTELNTSWSLSEIPIELDLEKNVQSYDPLLMNPCVDRLSCATVDSGSDVICSPSTTHADTVDTFGGTGQRYAFRYSGFSSSVFNDFNEPFVSTNAARASFSQGALAAPCEGSYHDHTADEMVHFPPLCSDPQEYYSKPGLHQTLLESNAVCFQQREVHPTPPRVMAPQILHEHLPVNPSSHLPALGSLRDECLSAPSSPQHHRMLSALLVSDRKHTLPPHLEWLQTITVEILIDQEGFRAVLARFKFMKYIYPESRNGNSDSESVQFRPIRRQVFLFHYAPFDGLPVLRRIAVNGEETRDYISKQASLGLKLNGVYFVSGSETLSFPLPHSHGKPDPKLQWRFEYAVDDKGVIGSSKKIDSGEKTLTPLSFSCSPLLLHPLQGKRVRLIQVVKKSVAAKLVAQRMRPPGLDNALSHVDEAKQVQPTIVHSFEGVASHRAPQYSYAEDYREAEHHLPSSITTVQHIGNSRSPRRRRASSAGEISHLRRDIVSLCTSSVHSPLSNNIIPPSHLISLMEADDSHSHEVLPVPTIASDRTSLLGFKPLSPRPRYD